MRPLGISPSAGLGAVIGMAVLAAGLVGQSSAAGAQNWWGGPSATPYYGPGATARYAIRPKPRKPARIASNSVTDKAVKANADAAVRSAPPSALLAIVSVSSQRIAVYDSHGSVMRSPVSTGMAGHRTPTGIFSVIQKNRFHASNIYSGAPMPYMQRITWSGIAMHAGALPGYPASHGCIRMPDSFASKLFSLSKMGMRVVVSPTEINATPFTHALLPTPVMLASAATEVDRRAGSAEPVGVRFAATEGASVTDTPTGAAPVAARLLNPIQVAQQVRTQARQAHTDAVKAANVALEGSLRASAEANQAAAALQTATMAHAVAQARLAAASTAEARQAAEALVALTQRTLDEALATDAVKSPAAYAAARASRDADDAIVELEQAMKVAERGVEPIAVFISRKEGKLFVRQGMVPLFEAPVSFKSPNQPLGTHVYQAMSADDASGRIGWMTVTVPNAPPQVALEGRAPVRRGSPVAVQEVAGPESSASEALERVVIAPDVMKRISERLWLNASLIISDNGHSSETGKGTDFIVLTR